MKKIKGISPVILKSFYTLVLVLGLILYISWTAMFLAPEGKYFDIGLFSICIILILFGIGGRFLYGELAKEGS